MPQKVVTFGSRNWQQYTVVLVLLLACSPQPRTSECVSDDSCHSGGQTAWCVDGRCQLCRTSEDCTHGMRCLRARCVRGEQGCEGDQDCLSSQQCRDRRCTPRPECDESHPCGVGQRCELGVCVAQLDEPPPQFVTTAGPCNLESSYFAYNDSSLDEQARRALQRNVNCFLRAPEMRFLVVGRGDPRGTQESNRALAEDRASTVIRYLTSLGIPEGRFESVTREGSTGNDESTWRFDRRVDFERLPDVPRRARR